jgi:hypothetical protein
VPPTLAVVPIQKQFHRLHAEEKPLPVPAMPVQRELQTNGISRQVVHALIVLTSAPVGQIVAVATPEGPLPRRKVQPSRPPSAATQEPVPLAPERRPHSRDGDRLLIYKRGDAGALAADVDRQAGWSTVVDTALKAAQPVTARARPRERADRAWGIAEHFLLVKGRNA